MLYHILHLAHLLLITIINYGTIEKAKLRTAFEIPATVTFAKAEIHNH